MSDGGDTTPSPSTRTRLAGTIARALILILAIALVAVVATRFNRWIGSSRYQTTDDAYLESDVTPLAARVPGYVQRVAVGDFDVVKKGQVLVELVDADYRAQLAQSEAAAKAAQAALEVLSRQREQQNANVDALRAALGAANATARLNHIELGRQQGLLAQGHYASVQAVDQALAADQQAGAVQSQQRAQIIAATRQLATI